MTDQAHEFEMEETEKRLAAHAAQAGVSAPTPLLSDDGAPSKEVMGYCNKHNLTLDWVYLGAEPKHRLGNAMAQQANTAEEKEEGKMDNTSFYSVKRETDHIDRLYRIVNLSIIGAAATDTTYKIDNLLDAHLAMYETIHALACEGIDIAEKAQRQQEARALTELQQDATIRTG